MALCREEDTTQLASPSTGNNVSVVAHVEDLIDIDSHSELIFETPPPDVVDSINECFKQFTSTVEPRSDANVTVHQPPSDSDSDESLFVTQSRTKAVQTKRQLGSSERPESISDDSGHRRENEDTENRRNKEQQAKSSIITKKAFFARRANFPFQSKSLRRQHIPLRKHQILENSEMGGFLKCIWKIEEDCVKTDRAISPSLLESELSDNAEGDDDNSDHEVTQVDRIIFVPSYLKRNKQQWLPQSFLEMRNEAQARSSVKQSICTLGASKSREILTACSNAEHLVTSKQKKKKKHKLKAQESFADTRSANNVHSAEMDQFSESQTTEMTLKRTKKKRKDKGRTKMAHLQPEHIHTSKKISGLKSDRKKKNGSEESQYESVNFAVDVNSVSQFDDVTDRLTPQETVEERPMDVEHTQAEFNNAEHSDSVQCAENLLRDNLSVLENGQRNSVKAVTEQAVEHEDDLMSDNNLPNKSSYFLPPQGGDISIQDDTQQTDSDFGSEDLFRPLNSQELEDNQIHKTASITANMEKIDQASDVTQIETEGQFVPIFGPRWCDGERHTYEKSDSDETQIETEGNSVSVFGSGTPNKQFTSQDINSAKHPKSQKTDQTPVSLNEKRKTVTRSHKDSDGTDVQEIMNVQPSSEHLPLAGEPLEETCSISSERLNLSKRRAMEEMETNPQETPLFKNGGLSFIKRKTKIKKKLGATDCDLNVDVRSESPVDDITGVKTAPRENKKNGVTNEEHREASVLHVEETSENLEESVADNSAITKVKRIKKKKHKLKEHEDVEPSAENQSVKSQFSESQTAEIISKMTKKKKRKDVSSNQTLDTDRPAELRVNDQSSEVPEMNEPECIQTSEEITGCLMTNVTTLKPVKKKKKKKKRDETEESVHLDVSSMSQLDLVDGVVEQQVIDERSIDYNTAKHLDGLLKAVIKGDGIIGLKKQASGSQSESTEVVLEKKTKKKQKLKEQKNAEHASDDFGSEDLFRPMNSQELEDNQIHKTASITANMEKNDQDSDVTQIETEGQYVSIFGPGTPRWCDGERHTYENSDSDETQIETQGNSVSVFGSGTPNKQFTSQDINSAKHPKSQNSDQTPVGLNEKRKTVSRSHKDSDGTDVQETMNVQPSSEHGCLMTNVTTLKPVKKKKKKKRDETEESVHLDVSSMSQLDLVDGVVEQQVIDERPIDYNTAKQLDGFLKAAKCKKKGSSSDGIFGLKKQASGSQSESTEVVLERKTKKKQKLKEQNNAELASDIGDNVHFFQQSESPTTDSMSRKTKKKRANKDRERTTDCPSNEIFDQMCDTPLEMRGNNVIHSNEATKINQFEHLQTSEEITRCSSPSVAKLSSGKKEKNKKDRSEKHQYDSVDVNLDVSQLDVVSGLMGQKMMERRPSVGSAVEGNEEHMSKVAKRKKKRQNTSSLSQADDIIGLENTVSENMVEHVEASKQKKKKKHKLLKGQEEAESGADNVYSVEMDQFSESLTTEMTLKRTKKKRKDKGRTNTAHLEGNSGTEILSNETCEAPETKLPEHTSEKISGLKSERKKKKKKNSSEESQYVSQFDDVTDRSTFQETAEERLSEVLEHTQAELSDTKHTKKRKQPSLSANNGSEFSSSKAEMQETVAPERKRKKKISDYITNAGGELIVESSDCTVLFKTSQTPILKSLESITKKSKKKKKNDKEMNKSINHIPDDSVQLETAQTTRTDSIIQHNNADRPANIIISLEDSADIRKKKKKRKKETANNITETSMS